MEQQPVPKKKGKKKWIAIGIVVVLVIVVAAIELSPKSDNLVSPGQLETLTAGQYYAVHFTASASGTITGQVNATNGVTVYIMDQATYNSDVNAGSFSSYSFTSGKVSSGSFNTNLGSGTWYVVFDNSNLLTSSSVDIVSLQFTS